MTVFPNSPEHNRGLSLQVTTFFLSHYAACASTVNFLRVLVTYATAYSIRTDHQQCSLFSFEVPPWNIAVIRWDTQKREWHTVWVRENHFAKVDRPVSSVQISLKMAFVISWNEKGEKNATSLFEVAQCKSDQNVLSGRATRPTNARRRQRVNVRSAVTGLKGSRNQTRCLISEPLSTRKMWKRWQRPRREISRWLHMQYWANRIELWICPWIVRSWPAPFGLSVRTVDWRQRPRGGDPACPLMPPYHITAALMVSFAICVISAPSMHSYLLVSDYGIQFRLMEIMGNYLLVQWVHYACRWRRAVA